MHSCEGVYSWDVCVIRHLFSNAHVMMYHSSIAVRIHIPVTRNAAQ